MLVQIEPFPLLSIPSLINRYMSKKKSEQLGMPFGTACNRLRLKLMYSLAHQAGMGNCFVCEEPIETPDDLSIEHKKPWLDKNPDLFWDLDNVAFSHRRCNRPHWRMPPSADHGQPARYRRGCRCEECRSWKREDNRQYRHGGRSQKVEAPGCEPG